VPAKWLHTAALCYCARHLTDGLLDETDLGLLIAEADMPRTAAMRSITKLVDVGLWAKTGEASYELRDYLDYNPSKADVQAKRQAAKDRMRAIRSFDVRANTERTSREVREPRPVPSQTQSRASELRSVS
jgi:hypothetical protein